MGHKREISGKEQNSNFLNIFVSNDFMWNIFIFNNSYYQIFRQNGFQIRTFTWHVGFLIKECNQKFVNYVI